MGTHLRVLSESYLMNTNMTGFRLFSKIVAYLCFGRKLPQQGLTGVRCLINPAIAYVHKLLR